MRPDCKLNFQCSDCICNTMSRNSVGAVYHVVKVKLVQMEISIN